MPNKRKPKNLAQKVMVLDVGPVVPNNVNADAGIKIEQLEHLKADPAWQIISDFYNEKVEILESIIMKDPVKKTEQERKDMELFVIKRNMSFQFGNIIDILIAGIKVRTSVNREVNLDPQKESDNGVTNIDTKGLI